MKSIQYIFFIILLYTGSSGQIVSKITRSDTLLYINQNHLELYNTNLIPNSVIIRNKSLLLDKSLFTVNPFDKKIIFNSGMINYSGDTLYIFYRIYPNIYLNEYSRREITALEGTTVRDTVISKKVLSANNITRESIFGKNIYSSGSITRGFTIGTTKDFSLNSGLRLQLSGRLSEDIEITAALTDENTPIQPEGNTETLDELDKVFIEVKHKNFRGIFGDIDYSSDRGEFGKIKRKLKGFQADMNYGNSTASIILASARGKYTENAFMGNDGVQGPYRLSGENNERNIIIIAGSERVYLDGEELKRGENKDYTIEYSTGEVFFTPARLITSASRITIDFEYSDRQYQRNYFGAYLQNSFFDNKLNLGVNYFEETDDYENPLDIILDENDKNILREAGDDNYKALISGVRLAEQDSTGNISGYYTKIDTIITGAVLTIYQYRPGEAESIYNVTFSYVGEGEGDYIRESLGHYRFVGISQGNYLPVKFLPLPSSKRLLNFTLQAVPIQNLAIDLEVAGSSFDKNRFSALDEGDNEGFARKILLTYKPSDLSIGGTSIGKIGFKVLNRFIQENFKALDRINEVEFNRYYNIPVAQNGDESLSEYELFISPFKELDLSSSYGLYSKGSSESSRYVTNVNLKSELYSLKYKYDYVNSTNSPFESDWLRQDAKANYTVGDFTLGLKFLHENREEYQRGSDSLHSSSLRYIELAPSLQFYTGKNINISLTYSYREELFPFQGLMESASISYTRGLLANYRDKKYRSTLNIALRKKEFTEIFKTKGFSNNETVLIKSQQNLSIGKEFIRASLYYEAATEKNSRLERIFIRVPQGTGNYKYLGDLNNNGVAEEYEFEPTIFDGDFIATTYPTDELFPVVDLKLNTRWEIDFSREFRGRDLISKILNPVSTETTLRISESSRESDISKIYLLNLASFLNDSTTIRGSNTFTQDIYLFKNKRDFSLRLRYIQQKSLNEFSSGWEKGFKRERSIRIRLGLIKEVVNQTEYVNKSDFILTQAISTRNRDVVSNELQTDFSYKPHPKWEVGFKVSTGTSEDYYPAVTTEISYNIQEVRINYSIFSMGRIRFELERSEYLANTSDNYIPFEITRGNAIGKNYIARINFDYKIGTNLQTTLNYIGRFHGTGRLINTLRAEARAFF